MSESEKQQEACSVGGSNRGVEEECSENVLRVTRGAPREPLPNWVDITEELFRATGALAMGEMIHDQGFSLHAAMSAFELMDPKVDAGNVSKADERRAWCETVDPEEVEERFSSPEHMLCFMDRQLMEEYLWLQGSTLGLTVGRSFFVDGIKNISNPILLAYTMCSIKLVSLMRTAIIQAALFEEEEFHSSGARLLQVDVPGSKSLHDTVSQAVQILEKEIAESSQEEEAKLFSAIIHRLMFKLKLVFIVESLWTGKVRSKLVNETVHAIAYLEDMIKHVTPDEQLWDCGAFCSLSSRTVALRPPQRTPFADVVEFMKKLTSEFFDLSKVFACQSVSDIFNFLERFSIWKPTLISRSLLHKCFLGQELILGLYSLQDLVSRSLSLPKDVTCCVEGVEWLHMMERFFRDLVVAYSSNRPRMHRKIRKLLQEQAFPFQSLAGHVDYALFPVLDNPDSRPPLCMGFSVEVISILMQRYLMLCLELELLALTELDWTFWHLQSICIQREKFFLFAQKLVLENRDKATSMLEENQKRKREHPASKKEGKRGRSNRSKKKGKKGESGSSSVSSTLSPESVDMLLKLQKLEMYQPLCPLLENEVIRNSSLGLLRFTCGLQAIGSLPKPSAELSDTETLRYCHRFGCLENLHFPKIQTLEQVLPLRSTWFAGVPPEELLGTAKESMSSTKEFVEKEFFHRSLQRNQKTAYLSVFLTSLVKVLEANSISASLFEVIHQRGNPVPKVFLDFSFGSAFPVFKLR